MALARESNSSPRAKILGTNMDVRTADGSVSRETAGVFTMASQPASSATAVVVPLAEEALLGSFIAEAEQPVPNSVTGSEAQRLIAKSVAGFPPQQFVPESVAGPAMHQFIPEAAAEPAMHQFIPETAAGPAMHQFIPEAVVERALDMRGNGVVVLGDKAEFVMSSADDMLPDGKAIPFTGVSRQSVVQSADVIASYLHETVAEFPAGEAPVNFVLDIPEHVSNALLAGDASIRSQPQEAMGSAIGLLTEPSSGAALSQLAPTQTVVNVTGVVREQVIDQVVRGVRVAQHNESTEVIVQLKPDFLGRLSIRVLADNHSMRVEIRSGNEAVRQVMQDNLADLQQRLSEKGFAFDQFNVLADTGSNPQREPEWNSGAPSIARSGPALKTLEEAPMELAPLAATSVIDYLA
jgi:hypothetical protein